MSGFEITPVTDINDLTDKKMDYLVQSNETKEISHSDKTLKEFEKDFELSRDVIVKILQESDSIIESMAMLAKSSDSPRAYEVLSKMMNDFVDSSGKLLDLHERYKKVKSQVEADGPKVQNNTQNNIVMTASPSELLNMLENKE